jgi:nascent polypeptide-associated complex subunit alpha
MFPGLPGMGGRGMSPKKMKGMLKSMGIDIDELEDVKEVVIRTGDREIIIENATVAVMDAHGVRSYQISGDSREIQVAEEARQEPELIIPDSDVDLVVTQTGSSQENAKAALVESKGDIAAAIMKLGTK